MRQRKLKGLEEKLSVYSGEAGRSILRRRRGNGMSFLKEISRSIWSWDAGRGSLSCRWRKRFPERNFIAVEGNANVMLRALQKAARFLRIFRRDLRSSDGSEKPFGQLNCGFHSQGNRTVALLTLNDQIRNDERIKSFHALFMPPFLV